MRPHRFVVAALLPIAIASCDDDPLPPHNPAPTEPATSELPSPPSPTPPNAAPDPAADGGAPDAGASIDALSGSWEGAYDAKKGRISLPSGVKDAARAGEDGKVAAGPGLVKVTILPNGDVSGKSQGALGNASVRGKIDGKTLRASFVPDDPLAPQAMTGVLIGVVKGEVIQVELRVAGPDALLVRQANFDLKKK